MSHVPPHPGVQAWNEPPNWHETAEEGLPDSPPYNQPATRDDMRQFDRDFPSIIDGRRYIHDPDRRRLREVPRRDRSNCRFCSQCEGKIDPYFPGRCPTCWRELDQCPEDIYEHEDETEDWDVDRDCFRIMIGLGNGNAEVNEHEHEFSERYRTCTCPCTCPPEIDPDPADEDYVPEDSDEEDLYQVADSTDDEVLGTLILHDHRGNLTHRVLRAETLEHYAAATEPQSQESELSSSNNVANTITPNEASILYRPPFRLELSVMLENGYSRDEIRQSFLETTAGRSTAYLPPSFIPYPEGPPSCFLCRRNYSPALRDAISMGLIRRLIRQNIAHEHEPRRFLQDSTCLRQLNAQTDTPIVEICRICSLPQREVDYLREWSHECACRCTCFEVPLPSPGSSESGETMDSI